MINIIFALHLILYAVLIYSLVSVLILMKISITHACTIYLTVKEIACVQWQFFCG